MRSGRFRSGRSGNSASISSSNCAARLNQEPVITLTDYALPAAELPAHFAEFVEYLNAPATPEHPWAQKRALWGHPEPYGVRYFELGNESGHGNHNGVPRRKFTPEEYADYAVKSAAAIRRADPSVKLGIVMAPGSGINWDCEWNRKVLAGAGAVADYVVLHFYGPAILNSGPEEALRAVLAYPDQLAAGSAVTAGISGNWPGATCRPPSLNTMWVPVKANLSPTGSALWRG